MAESLIDLEQVIRSKQDKLSTQEANFLMTWKEKTVQQLAVGAVAGGAIAWSVTGNLDKLFRINLAGGAAAITSLWRFKRSVNSCIEQVLCMDGTRMQRELANIMLRRYPNHPTTRNLLSKRFYCESVFDDSTSDTPKSRWRYRNNFVESAPHPQRTENHESSYNHDAKIGPERKPVPMNNGFVAMENPFDCIFGLPPSIEEIRRPVPTAPLKRHNRKHRKSQRRRHQIHERDDSLMLQSRPNHLVARNLMPKHFYCESVFDDSTSDTPKSRWRYRNYFVESAPHPQRTENHESSYNHDAKIGPERKPVPMNNGFVAMETPFDYVFGVPPIVDEIRRPVPAAPSRRHCRRQRRSQRRDQIHDHYDIL